MQRQIRTFTRMAGITLALAGTPAMAGMEALLQQAQERAMEAVSGGDKGGNEGVLQALSGNEMVSGLKEALAQGVQRAIEALGKTDGFLGDPLVRIPVPEAVGMVEQAARKMGQGQYADQFIESMNRSAEKATPEAAKILGDAIREMSVEDAAEILNGPEDAATRYFRKVSESKLSERFLPIVKEATDSAGVTAAYKQVVAHGSGMVGGLLSSSGLPGMGDDSSTLDLDQHVTTGALDGLFTYIAKEEKRIREDPLARSSDLLKKVFGKVAGN